VTNWPWPLQGVQSWFENLWNEVWKQAQRVLDLIIPKLLDVQNYLWEKVIGVRDFLWGKYTEVRDYLWGKLIDVRDYLWQKFVTVRDYLWGKIMDARDYVWNKLIDVRDYLWQKLIDVRDFLWGKYTEVRDYLWQKLLDARDYFYQKLIDVRDFLGGKFADFQNWLNMEVLDPWSDWLKSIVAFLEKFGADPLGTIADAWLSFNQALWKWTSEQTPTIMKLLTFSVTQDIFGEIQWIAERATSYSESGYDGFLAFTETLKNTSSDRMLPVIIEFLKTQSELRYDAVTWTQSLQMNPALRGLDFTEMFAHGEWQMLLAGFAGGFGMGIISMVVNKPVAYWLNSVIRPEILDVETLRTSFLREEISDTDVNWNLQRWGFDDKKIETIKKTWKWIPGPTDLIRLAVRESFTPPLVLDYESADYKKWMKKQGAEDWSDMFWHAHWVLPSISELSEMVHRNVIDDETWKKFVTLNDYWPPMVDNFKKIIYTPFTRVDIRRMYNSGVIDEEGVTRAYKDIGYDEEKAAKLTEFTKALKTGTAKDLTLSMIVKSFKQGNTSRDAALEMIVDLGYEEDEADFILSLYEQQTKEESRELSQSKFDAMFQLGLIDREELKRNLIALNYSTDAAENLVKIEEAKRDGKITLLPLGTLREALRRKILEPEDFIKRAKRLGYQDDEIEIVIALEEARVAA
jgi:hypothetical protein